MSRGLTWALVGDASSACRFDSTWLGDRAAAHVDVTGKFCRGSVHASASIGLH